MEMTWFQRAALIPSREMTRVYILNAIVAPFLLYLFISSDMPFGVIVAMAIFTGAAWHNAAAGIAINRIRESLEAEDKGIVPAESGK